jgi:hypothetical protein
MKFYVLKPFLLASILWTAGVPLQAQFDDVYYDPDLLDPEIKYSYDEYQVPEEQEEIFYYDDDSYAYYDNEDFYYSTRIKRFYHPYIGFGFYDPIYTSYAYYDPFGYDYYGYPGSSFYVNFGVGFNFGIGFGWGWPYYYGYNNWYYPTYTYPYYGGCNYYPYYPPSYCNAYYPPYYGGGSCGGGYYPPYGDHHDYYYGPRTTGNTGSSPRSPNTPPGIVRTDVKSVGPDITDSNDKPTTPVNQGIPGRRNPSPNPVPDPQGPSIVKQDADNGIVRQIPVDRELPQGNTPTGPKRPVFKPDTDKYQPYPTPARPTPNPAVPKPEQDNPRMTPTVERPINPSEGYKPYPRPEKQEELKSPPTFRPSAPPSSDREDDRPRYTPPPRPTERHDDKPSFSPPSRSPGESRGNDGPSYSPPSRSESQRSYEAPRHSPSPSGGHDSSPGSGRSSSGGSSGSSGHSSSPRGRG